MYSRKIPLHVLNGNKIYIIIYIFIYIFIYLFAVYSYNVLV